MCGLEKKAAQKLGSGSRNVAEGKWFNLMKSIDTLVQKVTYIDIYVLSL